MSEVLVNDLKQSLSLEQLKEIKRVVVENTTYLNDLIKGHSDSTLENLQYIVNKLRHNNNADCLSIDNEKLVISGTKDMVGYLDYYFGANEETGVEEVLLTIDCYLDTLQVGTCFDVNIAGEDYPFEGLTLREVEQAIEGLE